MRLGTAIVSLGLSLAACGPAVKAPQMGSTRQFQGSYVVEGPSASVEQDGRLSILRVDSTLYVWLDEPDMYRASLQPVKVGRLQLVGSTRDEALIIYNDEYRQLRLSAGESEEELNERLQVPPRLKVSLEGETAEQIVSRKVGDKTESTVTALVKLSAEKRKELLERFNQFTTAKAERKAAALAPVLGGAFELVERTDSFLNEEGQVLETRTTPADQLPDSEEVRLTARLKPVEMGTVRQPKRIQFVSADVAEVSGDQLEIKASAENLDAPLVFHLVEKLQDKPAFSLWRGNLTVTAEGLDVERSTPWPAADGRYQRTVFRYKKVVSP